MNCFDVHFRLRTCLFVLIGLAGCQTAPSHPERFERPENAQELLASVCSIGRKTHSVKGRVAIKARSDEASGQFPGSVVASAPDRMRLEINNFLGGTEAIVTIDRDRYEIEEYRGGKAQRRQGKDSWGGIPLHWATELFLGRIPCPVLSQKLEVSKDAEGHLVAIVPEGLGLVAQKFSYAFERSSSARARPKSLEWELIGKGTSSQVHFEFQNFDEEAGGPRAWEARSSKGSVKLKWRTRTAEEDLSPIKDSR